MCRELDALRQSMAHYAGGFDAQALTPSAARQVMRMCARIEASAASVKALAAARAAQGNEWKLDGHRSPADQLARETGISPGAARRSLEAGRRMAEQPDVAAAALAGDLSAEQAAAVADGVTADPTKSAQLIELAAHGSLGELNAEVARIKAANTDQEARRQARHARRSLRGWTDRDGALQGHLYGHPEDGSLLWRMLDPIRRRLNLLRRQRGEPVETLDALDYDALMTLAAVATGKDSALTLAELVDLGLFPQIGQSAPTDQAAPSQPAQGSRTKKMAGSPLRIMVRVDLDALLRGFPLGAELCEIAGYGPVPVSVVEDLLATESPFIVGLLTKGESLVGVYHHGRHPNAHQKSALDFLYPTCAVRGCSSRAGLQYDHREDWAKTKITAFDLLDRLCPHHHRRKTNDGWALIDGRGKRLFVPPDDPRHPRNPMSARGGTGSAGPDPPRWSP
jgi:Domain of unknown function (DUF222)